MRKKTKHLSADSIGVLLFVMMRMPKRIHTSKEIVISAKDVSFAAGRIAMRAVYAPARIAPMMIFGQVRLRPPKSFFIVSFPASSSGRG